MKGGETFVDQTRREMVGFSRRSVLHGGGLVLVQFLYRTPLVLQSLEAQTRDMCVMPLYVKNA